MSPRVRTESSDRVHSWHWHPAVRSGDDLTLGERMADRVRNGMGSWPFVIAFVGGMGIWAAFNGTHGFDPYPFILLNLLLSMVAGLQGAILLIAAKRADHISSELAKHTYDNTTALREMLARNTELTEALDRLTKQVHQKVCCVEIV